MFGWKRSSAHSMTACGGWSSYSTARSPPSRSSNTYRSSIILLVSSWWFLLLLFDNFGQRLVARQRDQFRVAVPITKRLETLALAPLVQVPPHQTFNVQMHLVRRHAPHECLSDADIATQAAAQINVIAFQLFAARAALAQGRTLQADVADP